MGSVKKVVKRIIQNGTGVLWPLTAGDVPELSCRSHQYVQEAQQSIRQQLRPAYSRTAISKGPIICGSWVEGLATCWQVLQHVRASWTAIYPLQDAVSDNWLGTPAGSQINWHSRRRWASIVEGKFDRNLRGRSKLVRQNWARFVQNLQRNRQGAHTEKETTSLRKRE